MKFALDEIRAALKASSDALLELGAVADGRSPVRYDVVARQGAEASALARGALARLEDLEKQIAEAEERGRNESFGVLLALREAFPTISGGIRHHAFKAREALSEVDRALCRYDRRVAERAKGGG